jgi:hypothetical protein
MMNKNVIRGLAATLLVAGAAVVPSQAATVIFSDDFDYDGTGLSYALDRPPEGWSVIANSGTVDWLNNTNSFGPGGTNLKCYGNTGGCVDLDGSTNNAGILTNGTYTLVQGTKYILTALVSGNQRNAPSDSLQFGFLDSAGVAIPGDGTQLIASIAANAGYTLLELSFTPGSTYTDVKIFFAAGGGDNIGPILDNVSLAAVPLPAAAWLLLSGLVGFGALGRRKVAA